MAMRPPPGDFPRIKLGTQQFEQALRWARKANRPMLARLGYLGVIGVSDFLELCRRKLVRFSPRDQPHPKRDLDLWVMGNRNLCDILTTTYDRARCMVPVSRLQRQHSLYLFCRLGPGEYWVDMLGWIIRSDLYDLAVAQGIQGASELVKVEFSDLRPYSELMELADGNTATDTPAGRPNSSRLSFPDERRERPEGNAPRIIDRGRIPTLF